MSDLNGELLINVHQSKLIEDNKEEIKQDQSFQKPQMINQDVLKADNNIIPFQEKKQMEEGLFSKAAFAKNVEELNKASRSKQSEYRVDVKDGILGSVSEIKERFGKNNKMPKDLNKVITQITSYANIRAVAKDNKGHGTGFFGQVAHYFKSHFNIFGNRSTLKKEHELIRKLPRKIQTIIDKYSNDENYAPVVSKLSAIRTTLINTSGTVEKPEENQAEKFKNKGWKLNSRTKQISGVGFKMQTSGEKQPTFFNSGMSSTKIDDRREWPLFAHEPTTEDISQGEEGNCWFLSTLATLSSKQVRDMMMDNGDGTVTVRFFKNNTARDEFEPVYVTVDKNVKINGALDCLWVQVFEKAYALFLQNDSNNKFYYGDRKQGMMIIDENTPSKMIKEGFIDYGYVSNGGMSEEALMNFLGQKGYTIEIENGEYSSFIYDDVPHIINEAIAWGDEETAAFAEYNLYHESLIKCDKQINLYKEAMNNMAGFNVEEKIQELKDKLSDCSYRLSHLSETKKGLELITAANDINDEMSNHNKEIKIIEHRFKYFRNEIYKREMYKLIYGVEIDDIEEEKNKLEDKYSKPFNGYQLDDRKTYLGKELVEMMDSIKQIIRTKNPNIDNDMLEGLNTILPEPFIRFTQEELFKVIDNAKPKLIAKEKVNPKDDIFIANERDEVYETISANNSVEDFEKFLNEAENQVSQKGKLYQQAMKNMNLTPTFEIIKTLTDVSIDEEVERILSEYTLKFIEKARKGLHRVCGMKGKIIEGEYSKKAVGYYDTLKSMLNSHQNIVLSTRDVEAVDGRGGAGEAQKAGMVGTHCYSVHDVKEVNGRKLVLLRNPWGNYTVKYKENKNTLESYAEGVGDNGTFWIELNHMLYFGDSINSGGVVA